MRYISMIYKSFQGAWVTPIVGGILGIAIFLTAPELLGVQNVWNALLLGIVSGASATGANQIIKKIFNKGEN